MFVSIENAFNFLSPEYLELFRASVATVFQHPLWLARFYAGLPEVNHAEPLIVVVRAESEGRLMMVLPLVRRRYGFVRVVEAADLGVSDYVAPAVGRQDLDRILADKPVRNDIGKAVRPHDLIRIGKLTKSALVLGELLGIAKPTAMGTNAYAVRLSRSFDEWRAANLPDSYRKELAKKSRQLHRKGAVLFELVTDPAVIRESFEALRRYRGLRFGNHETPELLQRGPYYEFYLGLATSGGDLTRTYVYWVDDHPAAVVFALSIEGRVLVILSGFDHAQYKNQSIGALMFEQIARDCIERGDEWLDFTIGDEPYKVTFGAQPEPMWMAVRSRGIVGWLARLSLERIPNARSIVRRLLHKPDPAVNAEPLNPSAADVR